MRHVVCCWGTGDWAERSIKQLENSEYEILFFCDTDKNKQGKLFHGYPIVAPAKLKEKALAVDGIVITTLHLDSVIKSIYDNSVITKVIGYWNAVQGKVCKIEEFYAQMIFSQEGEDVYLRDTKFNNRDKITYVDVCAYHPYRFSNTYWAYRCGGRGINIEPNEGKFKLFEVLRPNDININCGVSDKEEELDYYIFKEGALNTFKDDEIRDRNKVKEIKKVNVRRLDSILAEYKFKDIDFMDIDVEGLEMNVLRSINFDAVNIECILLEQRNKTLSDIMNSGEYKFLKLEGYEAVNKYGRTVIYEKMC